MPLPLLYVPEPAGMDQRQTNMTYRRLMLLAAGAGVLVAVALALINLVSGPGVCVSQPICKQPASGEGCLPVAESCSGLLLSVQAVVALSVGAGVLVAVLLGVRRSR